jgi:hypothetical protein
MYLKLDSNKLGAGGEAVSSFNSIFDAAPRARHSA